MEGTEGKRRNQRPQKKTEGNRSNRTQQKATSGNTTKARKRTAGNRSEQEATEANRRLSLIFHIRQSSAKLRVDSEEEGVRADPKVSRGVAFLVDARASRTPRPSSAASVDVDGARPNALVV